MVWLLEELGLKYEVKPYVTVNYKAPEQVKEVHPLGKCPLVEIVNGEDRLVLAESGHIFSYLMKHYGQKSRLAPTSAFEDERVDYFLHFSEPGLQTHLLSVLVGMFAVKALPWGVSYLVAKVVGQLNEIYYFKEIRNTLAYLDSELESRHYFGGSHLTAADIMLSFPVYENLMLREDQPLGDVRAQYPNLAAWADRIAGDRMYLESKRLNQ